MRVIGRRKGKSSPPAESATPIQEESSAEATEWRVIGPEVGVEAEPAPEEGEPEGEAQISAPPGPPIDSSLDGDVESRGERRPATLAGDAGVSASDRSPAVPAEEPPSTQESERLSTEPGGHGPELKDPDQENPQRDAPVEPSQSEPDERVSTGAATLEAPADVILPAEKAEIGGAPVVASAEHPKHAPSQEDPISSVLLGPGPQGQRTLPRVIAIANQKGGVGKTTTTVNLGAALADLDYRVLVVDLDPQGNATTGLGIDARNFEYSMYDVIMHETPMEDCIEPTSVRNLFVAPATIDLAGVEIELVPAFSRELRLRKAIERIVDDFDFVMIDCPPSLGLITINGLAAASEVLVPIQCEYYALEGLSQLLRNVHLVASNLNERLEVSAIVLTMYDGRTRLAVDVAAEVREHFTDKVCRNVIPRTIRLSEAPSFGQPITVFDPTSRGAIAYRELAKEVSNGASKRAG